MKSLKYKTIGESTPFGKQNVFFSCHPEDFERSFTVTANSILKHQNCAVWYYDGQSGETSDLSDLSGMQLFVMPVTRKLLTEPNDAVNVYLPFAQKHDIPVLPLMLEKDKEMPMLFYKAFGKIQYLTPNDSDETALKFDDKLEKYLSELFINKESFQKVYAAFQKHIFLSYRKKDRKYTNELISTIRRCPKLLFTAVWYDEYLTPAEDYNEEIANAIKKCDAFVLAVTPNLLAKPNYVITHEYPMALAENKTIIPILMEDVDPAEFNQTFPDLKCVAPKDQSELEAMLSNALGIGGPVLDITITNEYYIGLAYLHGIGVKVNRPMGVSLIETAAKLGYEPAVRKLISMYRFGQGVKTNKNAELQWIERLLDLQTKALSKDADLQKFFNLQKTYFVYAETLLNTEHIEEAIATLEGRVKLFENLAREMSKASGPEFSSAKAKLLESIYMWLGEILSLAANASFTAHRDDDAIRLYHKSNEIYLSIKNGGNDDEYRFVKVLAKEGEDLSKSKGILLDLTHNYCRLGRIETFQKHYSSAKEFFGKAKGNIDEFNKIYGIDTEPGALVRLSDVISDSSWMTYLTERRASEAVENFTRAIRIMQSVCAQNHQDYRNTSRIATDYQRLAVAYAEIDLNEAYKNINIAMAINRHLVFDRGLTMFRQNMNIDENKLQLIERMMTESNMVPMPVRIDAVSLINSWKYDKQALIDLINNVEKTEADQAPLEFSIDFIKTKLIELQKKQGYKNLKICSPGAPEAERALSEYASEATPGEVIAIDDQTKKIMGFGKAKGILYTQKAVFSSHFENNEHINYADIKHAALYYDGVRFKLKDGKQIVCDFGQANDFVLGFISELGILKR